MAADPEVIAPASSDLVPVLELVDHIEQLARNMGPLLLNPHVLVLLIAWREAGRPRDFKPDPPFDARASIELLSLIEKVSDHCAAAIGACFDIEEAASAQLSAN